MAASVLPDLVLAAHALLDGHPTLGGVKVFFGPPPAGHAFSEWVAVGAGEKAPGLGSSREWRTLPATNPTAVEEQVSVPITIQALQATGDDLKTPYQRAVDIADAVETVLGSDLTVTNAVWFSLTVQRRENPFRTDKQRGAQVFLTLSGTARRSVG